MYVRMENEIQEKMITGETIYFAINGGVEIVEMLTINVIRY